MGSCRYCGAPCDGDVCGSACETGLAIEEAERDREQEGEDDDEPETNEA
jgi:hypothetical protein